MMNNSRGGKNEQFASDSPALAPPPGQSPHGTHPQRREPRPRGPRTRLPPVPMEFDETFKILLVGDSGVGKSSILLRFTDDVFEAMQPTIGVDFKVKAMKVDNRRVKMTIWDTAGQERFRTLTSAYYRGAHGVILVYDVSKRETFDALKEVWLKEVSMYSTRSAAVKMVVGNKVDIEDRQVSREEGLAFARQQSTLFVESSAKTATGVQQTFEELLRKILETPELCTADSSAGNVRPSASGQGSSYAESCSC